MKTNLHVLFVAALICAIFPGFGCGDSNQQQTEQKTDRPTLDHLPADKAGMLIRQSIETAGGWENWLDKQTISYQKHMQFFDSAGNVDREVQQLHQYQLHPQFRARISWEQEGAQSVIMNNGQQAWKAVNNVVADDQASINQAWNASFGSHYVMCMPFKLADPGVVPEYLGPDTLTDGLEVEVVKITYEEGAGSAAGMHTWYYMFDPESAALVANFLNHGQGYSFTRYETWEEVDGIQLPVHRISYSTDSLRNPIAGHTVYHHHNILFDVPLSDDLFEPEQD